MAIRAPDGAKNYNMEGNRSETCGKCTGSNYFRKLFVLLFAKFLTSFYAALPFFCLFIALTAADPVSS